VWVRAALLPCIHGEPAHAPRSPRLPSLPRTCAFRDLRAVLLPWHRPAFTLHRYWYAHIIAVRRASPHRLLQRPALRAGAPPLRRTSSAFCCPVHDAVQLAYTRELYYCTHVHEASDCVPNFRHNHARMCGTPAIPRHENEKRTQTCGISAKMHHENRSERVTFAARPRCALIPAHDTACQLVRISHRCASRRPCGATTLARVLSLTGTRLGERASARRSWRARRSI
jgi:hypothetical protein